MKRSILVLIVVLIGAALALYFISPFSSKHGDGTYKYAFVVTTLAEQADPKYSEYEAAKQEYENRKAQYEAEGHMRQWRMNQKGASTISHEALERSLSAAYEAKMAVKASENEAKLMAAYNFYVHKYADVWGLNPTELDLRIVNLQLRIYSLSPYMKNHDQVKASLESELQDLLVGRDPSLSLNDTRLRNKVLEAVSPLKSELAGELEAYKFAINKELNEQQFQQRQLSSEFDSQQGLSPDEGKWRVAWESEIAKQEELYKKLHAEIEARVKATSEEVASQRNLTLVAMENAPTGESQDITTAVIAALSKDNKK